MDYAKYSYIKLSETEAFLPTTTKASVASNSVEFNSGVLNKSITSVSDYSCGSIYMYGSASLQIKAIFNAYQTGTVLLEMLIDKVPVLAEERVLNVGENQVILIKAYSPSVKANATITLRVKILSSNYSCTLTNCVLCAWGNVFSADNLSDVQMRALTYNNNLILSYSQNNNIYMTQSSIQEKSFASSDFTLVAGGVSHSFATDKNNQLYLFRVDASGNLFYSRFNSVLQETKVDDNVSVVFACKCTDGLSEDILICYIKNGQPMYRCMTNGTIGSATCFKLPAGKYIDIEIADTWQTDNMFVICTHENYSNYILYSVSDKDFLHFVESLNASVVTVCRRYVNLYTLQNNTVVETLKADFLCNVNRVLAEYENLLSNKITENLNLKVNLSTSLYTIAEEPEINYELSYSQLSEYVEGAHRVTYGADCADWQPATMDVYNTGSIIDTYGILNKWPFNKIKPCLVEDGKLIGYLNPNDYSQYEDGTPADITNINYDVMVEFPKIYYKIEEDWDGIAVWNTCQKANIKIYISNKPKQGYICYAHTKQGIEYDSIYVSAYENFINSNNQILCCSGVAPHSYLGHGLILDNFYNCRSQQYTTFSVHVATLIRILSILLFKEYEGQYVYGMGFKGSKENLQYTGVNNTKGMFYGLFNVGEHCNKLFGLENITGHCHVFLDGLLTTNDNHYLIYDPTNPNCKLGYSGEYYKEFAPTMSTMLTSYLVRVSAQSECGFLPVCNIPLQSRAKPFYNCFCEVRPPSKYTNAVDTTNLPYMIYEFGGFYNTTYQSLFTQIPAYNFSDVTNNAERLVCYPSSRTS